MRGFIRQRGTSWEVIVEAGRDPITGRRRQRSRSCKGGKRDAERLLAQMLGEDHGAVSTASTFGELLEDWYAAARTKQGKPWSSSTLLNHRQIIDAHLSGAIARMPLRKITPKMLDDLYRALEESGAKGGGPLAPSTVHRTHVVVSSALGLAVRWGWLKENPAARANPPSGESLAEVEPPTPSEVVAILAAARAQPGDGPALECFLRISATCGMRPSEVCDLRWDRIDLSAGELVLMGASVRARGGVAQQATKTKARRRLAVDADTVAALAAHRARMAQRTMAVGIPFPSGGFVFSDEADLSRPWRPDSTSRKFRTVVRRLGLDVDLYHLRHFTATYMLAGGIDAKAASGRLSHTTMAMIDKVYGHRVPAADRAAADVLGRLLRSGEA